MGGPDTADARAILEALRQKISTQEMPAPTRPPSIDQNPELTPDKAKEFERMRDETLKQIRGKIGGK